jgi:DnaJ-class molecular chaperone
LINRDDAFNILKISSNSIKPEVKSAYRNLAKIHHPDLPTGSTEQFRKITEAYNILLNSVPETRVESQIKNKAENTIFRILNGAKNQFNVVFVEDTIPANTRFMLMINDKEFSVFFEKQRQLPFTIKVKDYILVFVKGK